MNASRVATVLALAALVIRPAHAAEPLDLDDPVAVGYAVASLCSVQDPSLRDRPFLRRMAPAALANLQSHDHDPEFRCLQQRRWLDPRACEAVLALDVRAIPTLKERTARIAAVVKALPPGTASVAARVRDVLYAPSSTQAFQCPATLPPSSR